MEIWNLVKLQKLNHCIKGSTNRFEHIKQREVTRRACNLGNPYSLCGFEIEFALKHFSQIVKPEKAEADNIEMFECES